MRQPYTAYLEVTGSEEPIGDTVWATVTTQSFYLSLTTATAIGLRSAVLVCDALHERGVLPKVRRPNVELCLHEAIANALVHGNLGVDSSHKSKPEGYKVFSHLISERLRDPSARQRRVEVFARWDREHLDIGVADQGSGFDISTLPVEADDGKPSGRGFLFMRALATSVTISDGGRCTSLRFPI